MRLQHFINIGKEPHPNGLEELIKGHNYIITWSSVDITGNVQIDLYKNNSRITQLAVDAPNTGSYTFNIPNILPDSNDYRIRISTMNDSVADFSDSYFTISSSPGLIFSDNFNDGNAFGWEERSGNWTVENGQYSSYLNGCGIQGDTLIGSTNWIDYIYEIDVIRLEGVEANLAFRVNQDSSKFYRVAFRTGWYYDFGQDYVFLFKDTGLLTVINYSLQLNVWHRIKIEAIGNNIKIYIKRKDEANFNLLIDYTDNNNPNLSGKVGIFDWSGDKCITHNHYDNMIITGQ